MLSLAWLGFEIALLKGLFAIGSKKHASA